MNRKIVFFAIGALAGVLIAFSAALLIMRGRPSQATIPSSAPSSAGIRNPSDVENRIEIVPSPAAKPPQPPAPPTAEAPSDDESKNGLLSKLAKTAARSRITSQVDELSKVLKLSPDQRKSIEGILEKQINAAMSVALGKSDADSSQLDSTDAQIRRVLNEDQVKLYEDWKEQQSGNVSSQIIDVQMRQLQMMVSLTPSQVETTRRNLEKLSAEYIKSAAAEPPSAGQMEVLMKQQRDALEGVIPVEKIEELKAQHEMQLKLIRKFLPGAGDK